MLRYEIVSGILLVLSIINFALAAPVLVQDSEKRQACVDMVHISKDVITMLGKRGFEDIEKLVEDFFNTGINPTELSDAHVPSSSAPLGPDHGSTSVVQAPGPNTASSLYDPDHELTGAHAPQPNPNSGPLADSYFDVNYWFPPASPTEFGKAQVEHVQQSNPGPSTDSDFDWNHWTNLVNPPLPRPPSPKEIDQAQEYEAEHVQQPNSEPSTDSYFDSNYLFPPAPRPASPAEFGQAPENQVGHVQQPNPGPSADSDFDWNYWQNLVNRPPPRPALPKEIDQAHENQAEHVQQPNPVPSTGSDFDWDYWTKLVNPPPAKPALPNDIGLAPENQVGHVQQPNPVPSTDSDFDWDYWMKLVNRPPKDSGSVVHPPSLGAGSPTDPENKVVAPPSPGTGSLTEPDPEVVPGPPPSPIHDQLSSAPGFQPTELQAAASKIKGKEKESRGVSGTARDDGNTAPEGIASIAAY